VAKNELGKVLKDDQESLALLIEAFADLQQRFCDYFVRGMDYTMSLELRGDKGKLLHAKIADNTFRRPKGVSKQDYPERK